MQWSGKLLLERMTGKVIESFYLNPRRHAKIPHKDYWLLLVVIADKDLMKFWVALMVLLRIQWELVIGLQF